MIENIGASIERYMSLLSARQKLVSANIANADTPGYKTKDIDFRSELRASLASGSNPTPVEAPGLTPRNDGNNVSLDREARMLAENALRFNIAANLAKAQLRTVRAAIDEGKSA